MYFLSLTLMEHIFNVYFLCVFYNFKVVETVDLEDIDEQKVFCRCWKSNNVSCATDCFNITELNIRCNIIDHH